MNTLQHSLITLLEIKDIDIFKEVVPYVLLPDAIRCYTKERKWSHFETEPNTKEPNIFKYPTDIKNYDNIDMKGYVENNVQFRPAVIGEDSSLEAFQKSNQHLPDLMYVGIQEHLRQDISFDKWIREEYDCSRKYEDAFVVNGQEIDGKAFRGVIGQMEMEAVGFLSYLCHEKLGVTITNDWFKENVFEPINDIYSERMAENTCKYIVIPENIEKQIINGEWEQLFANSEYLTVENYMNYHNGVVAPIDGIERDDLELEEGAIEIAK